MPPDSSSDDSKLSIDRAFSILKELAEDSVNVPAETRRKIATDILLFNGAVGGKRAVGVNVTEEQLAVIGRVLIESESLGESGDEPEGAVGTLTAPRTERPLLSV